MKGYTAFLRKEFVELWRTYKLLILLCVFFALGMISALTAKLLPEILSAMPMEGISIVAPDPTAKDAWEQLFKNTTQLGMLALVLIFSGSLPGEIARGTLTPLLARGLGRQAVVLAKYTATLLAWTAALALAAGLHMVYTLYLFPGDTLPYALLSLACLWLFGAFLLAVMLLWGALLPGNYGGLTGTAGTIIVLFILGIFPPVVPYLPTYLASVNLAVMLEAVEPSKMIAPACITLGGTIASLAGAIAAFARRKL